MPSLPLQTCDILVVQTLHPRGLEQRAEVWALGNPSTHVFMYLGRESLDLGFTVVPAGPVIYESDGRGVLIRPIVHYVGTSVKVVRPQIPDDIRKAVIIKARDIAYDTASFYDYTEIVDIAWHLLERKLHRYYILKQHLSKWMICSEAVARPFWDAGFTPVMPGREPLPNDFLTQPASVLAPVVDGPFDMAWVM